MTIKKGIIYLICFVVVVGLGWSLRLYTSTLYDFKGVAYAPIFLILFILGGVFISLSIVNFIFGIFKK